MSFFFLFKLKLIANLNWVNWSSDSSEKIEDVECKGWDGICGRSGDTR